MRKAIIVPKVTIQNQNSKVGSESGVRTREGEPVWRIEAEFGGRRGMRGRWTLWDVWGPARRILRILHFCRIVEGVRERAFELRKCVRFEKKCSLRRAPLIFAKGFQWNGLRREWFCPAFPDFPGLIRTKAPRSRMRSEWIAGEAGSPWAGLSNQSAGGRGVERFGCRRALRCAGQL